MFQCLEDFSNPGLSPKNLTNIFTQTWDIRLTIRIAQLSLRISYSLRLGGSNISMVVPNASLDVKPCLVEVFRIYSSFRVEGNHS